MPNTMKSAELLKKYLKLFKNCYEEPQEIVILGTFGSKSAENIRGNEKIILLEERSQSHLSQIQNQQVKKKGKSEVGLSDLMTILMFKNAANKCKGPKENKDDSAVVLD